MRLDLLMLLISLMQRIAVPDSCENAVALCITCWVFECEACLAAGGLGRQACSCEGLQSPEAWSCCTI